MAEPALPRPAPPARRLPRGEHALHPLLIVLLLLILVAKPMVDLHLLPERSLTVAMVFVIIAGLFALEGTGRWTSRALLIFGLATALLHLYVLHKPGTVQEAAAQIAAIFALLLLGAAVLRQTFAPGRVTIRRIEGAVVAWLLLGMVFAAAYELVSVMDPGAFLLNGAPVAPRSLAGDFLFFSFITQSTTGYGDMVPVHPVARALAVTQVLSGTLFTTVLLARLVSLEIADRSREG